MATTTLFAMDFSDSEAIRQAFQHLQQRINTLEGQLATTNQQLTTVTQQLATATQQLATVAQTLETPAPAVNPPARPRAVLPDPDKFGGTHYDTWLPLITAKLDIDGEALGGTDRAHFWYTYGNLEPKIQSLVLPLATARNLRPSLIFDSLARIYSDPNKASRASDRLAQIKQGTDSLPHYLARFERTLFEAGALEWPDAAKISTLRQGLCDALKKKLEVQLTLPATYDGFVRTLHQLSGHAKPTFVPTSASTSHDHNSNKMDIGAINVRARFEDNNDWEDSDD